MRATVSAALLPLLTLVGCASAGGPAATVNDMEIAGVWGFDVLLQESIRGTVTFTGDDRYTVRCQEDLTRPDPSQPLTARPGALEFQGCGATFRVRRGEDGRVVADVSRTVQEPYTAQGPCVQTRTYDDGSVRCVSYEDVIAYRQRQVQTHIELQPIVGMG